MTREDYIWVAIRVLGLYVLILAFLAAVNGLAATPVILYQSVTGQFEIDGLTPIATSLASLTFSIVKAVILFYVGDYLIRDGKWVFEKISWWTDAA